jgi:hypothetical protein
MVKLVVSNVEILDVAVLDVEILDVVDLVVILVISNSSEISNSQ